MELIFEVRDAEEGGYCARALGHAIFTEAETWDELRGNVLEAVSVHFEEEAVRPRLVQLQNADNHQQLISTAPSEAMKIPGSHLSFRRSACPLPHGRGSERCGASVL
jgi:hypothetical protein